MPAEGKASSSAPTWTQCRMGRVGETASVLAGDAWRTASMLPGAYQRRPGGPNGPTGAIPTESLCGRLTIQPMPYFRWSEMFDGERKNIADAPFGPDCARRARVGLQLAP